MQIARWGGGPARALRVQSARPGCTSGGSWLPAAGAQTGAGVVVSLVLDRRWGVEWRFRPACWAGSWTCCLAVGWG